MTNAQIITKFYSSFAQKKVAGMVSLYHDDVVFEDPAFGKLQGENAKNMWRMLLERMDAEATITYNNVHETKEGGSASWEAIYRYGKSKRKVINNIKASFKIRDGLIVEHVDSFSMWNWSRQALGLSGLLLGWTPFIKNKVQQTTNALLKSYNQK